MNTDTKILDSELVDLYVDEYKPVAIGLYPDLEQAVAGGEMEYNENPNVSDNDMRSALEDCMADRIYDGESIRKSDIPFAEVREAAKKIAVDLCGEETS